MATNVTEKDKTLNEIIDWAKSRCHEAALSRFDVRRKSETSMTAKLTHSMKF